MKIQITLILLFMAGILFLPTDMIAQSSAQKGKNVYPITADNYAENVNQFDLQTASVATVSEADMDVLLRLQSTLEAKIQSVTDQPAQATPLQNQLAKLNQAIALKEQ